MHSLIVLWTKIDQKRRRILTASLVEGEVHGSNLPLCCLLYLLPLFDTWRSSRREFFSCGPGKQEKMRLAGRRTVCDQLSRSGGWQSDGQNTFCAAALQFTTDRQPTHSHRHKSRCDVFGGSPLSPLCPATSTFLFISSSTCDCTPYNGCSLLPPWPVCPLFGRTCGTRTRQGLQ